MPAFLQSVPKLWAAKKAHDWSGLQGGALAQAVSRIHGQTVVVVVPTEKEAEALVGELRFFRGASSALLLPADDNRPYDGQSPHPSRPRQRIQALHALSRGHSCFLVAPVEALLLKMPPLAALEPVASLCVDEEVDPDAIAKRLLEAGYLSVGRVEDEGSFRLRADRLDVWPTGRSRPVRVEFFDVEVESLREFDPDTQRSGEVLEGVTFLPADEVVLSEETLQRAGSVLAEVMDTVPDGPSRRRQVLSELRDGLRFSGCEEYLGALLPLAPLPELLGRTSCLVVEPERCEQVVEARAASIQNRFEAVPVPDRPMIGPSTRFWDAAPLLDFLKKSRCVHPLEMEGSHHFDCRGNDGLRPAGKELTHVLGRIAAWLEEGWRVGIVVESSLRAERVDQLLRPHGFKVQRTEERDPDAWEPGALQLLRGRLPRGFHAPVAQIAMLSADEVFGRKHRVRSANRSFSKVAKDAAVKSFSELKEGDLVVHRLHGIGLYIGLHQVDVGQGPADMLQVEYRGGDRLYLPVHRLGDIA
ncbi:MAG: CarD family transcriptional regulator, partial [Myxococcota bacterium]|nr:CarD family transcriptional regulator [Myxococcota bacterium]